MLYDKKWDKVKVETVEPWQTLLQATIGVLEKNGWCQRMAENSDGTHCLLAAIDMAEETLNVSCTDRQRAFTSVKRTIGSDSIVGWNDTHGRTKAEVIDALRKAIAFK